MLDSLVGAVRGAKSTDGDANPIAFAEHCRHCAGQVIVALLTALGRELDEPWIPKDLPERHVVRGWINNVVRTLKREAESR